MEDAEAAVRLEELTARYAREIGAHSERKEYAQVIQILAKLVEPVDRFFTEVLVLDPDRPAATLHRWQLLSRLREALTRIFDIRELAGQADGRQ